MKKIKLFTHTDLDGIGCAIVAIKILGAESVDIEYVDYNNVDQRILKWVDNYNSDIYNGKCFITDISISENTAKILDKIDINFYLLDHHATAVNLNKYSWCEIRTLNKFGVPTSGAEMLYEYFLEPSNKNLKQFVQAVRDYDTWQWVKTPNGKFSKALNDLFNIYDREYFISKVLNSLNTNSFYNDFITDSDKQILILEQQKINKIIKNKDKELNTISLWEYQVGVVFAEEYISELGNKLCIMHPEIDFIALVNVNSKTISFRTIKNIDIGKKIASKFGGGGHPKSAGAPLSKDAERLLQIYI